VLLSSAFALTSCAQKTPEQLHEEEAEKIYALNVMDAHGRLEYYVSENSDSIEADALTHQYYRNFGDWMWADSPAQLQRSHDVYDYLCEHVPMTGFSPDAFYLNIIKDDLQRLDSLWFDKVNTPREVMASLEYHLTKAYVRYAQGQRYGFSNPVKVFNHLDKDGNGTYKGLFDIKLEQADSTFKHDIFMNVADGTALSFLQGCEPSDSVYARLQEAMLNDSTADGRQRLLYNMERRRWRDTQPADSAGRYILVNIPSQQLWAVSPDSVFNMRVCLGAFKTKTPTLSSGITRIDFNPEWNIPMSILRNEVSHHAGDDSYFQNRRYRIIDTSTGKTVSGSQVSAAQMRSGRFRVAQASGAGNSLGRIIFRFPNKFSVYLHDTNNRSAFSRDRRTVSHGCVRLQRPFDIVKFVMADADEWTLDRMRLSIDMKPETKRGKDYLEKHPAPNRLISSQSVKHNVPVYLHYYTVYPNPLTGIIETWKDRYEYDPLIDKALRPYM